MRTAPSSPGSKPLSTGVSAPALGRTTAPPRSFIAILDERVGAASRADSPAAPSPASARPKAPRGGNPLRAMLERAIGNEKQIDALLDAAAHGKTFKPAELLAMQATVARYSQTVEVVSRVADRLVGAVKQTMGTQV
jgi:hypothetical protein